METKAVAILHQVNERSPGYIGFERYDQMVILAHLCEQDLNNALVASTGPEIRDALLQVSNEMQTALAWRRAILIRNLTSK